MASDNGGDDGDCFSMDFPRSNGQAYGPGFYFGLSLHARTFVGDTPFRMTEENFLGQELAHAVTREHILKSLTNMACGVDPFEGKHLVDEPLTEELTEELMTELADLTFYSGLRDNAIVVQGPNSVAENAEDSHFNLVLKGTEGD